MKVYVMYKINRDEVIQEIVKGFKNKEKAYYTMWKEQEKLPLNEAYRIEEIEVE